MNRTLRFLEIAVLISFGAAISSVAWAAYTSATTVPRDTCIPLYTSGLECCK